MNTTLQDQIVKQLLRSEHILLMPSAPADGDSLGSSLALYKVLKKIGKKATVISAEQVPKDLQFLPMIDAIDGQKKDSDLIITVQGEVKHVRHEIQSGKVNIFLTPQDGEPLTSDNVSFNDRALDEYDLIVTVDTGDLVQLRDFYDQLFHVVRLVRILGDQRVEALFNPARLVKERANRRLVAVVKRQEVHETANLGQGFDVIFKRAIGNRRLLGVCGCATQFFGGHNLVGDGFHNVGTSDEHVRAVFDHEDKVGHRWRVHRAARTWAHDDGNLRHNARRHNIALEHFSVASKRGNAFLNTRTSGIVYANHRRAVLHRHIHDFANWWICIWSYFY